MRKTCTDCSSPHPQSLHSRKISSLLMSSLILSKSSSQAHLLCCDLHGSVLEPWLRQCGTGESTRHWRDNRHIYRKTGILWTVLALMECTSHATSAHLLCADKEERLASLKGSNLRLEVSRRRQLWLLNFAYTVNIYKQTRRRLCSSPKTNLGKAWAFPGVWDTEVLDIAGPLPTTHVHSGLCLLPTLHFLLSLLLLDPSPCFLASLTPSIPSFSPLFNCARGYLVQ